ncbi:UPF0175 family protein [Candidatus Micrarchaeota archaeon]|nr:UPF0175 family protein [Candidatus Micrarchaeota archaeon]
MTVTKMRLISIRIPDELNEQLADLSEQDDLDKSTLIREVLTSGLEQKKLELALERYKKGKITLSKAAYLAGISLWKMFDILKERKIDIQYSEDDFKEDLKALNGE